MRLMINTQCLTIKNYNKMEKIIVESFGKIMSPILLDVEVAMAEYNKMVGRKPNYDRYALRSAVNIFISVLMDRVWELQEKEEMDIDTRKKMAQSCGDEIRRIVKIYTDLDTYDEKSFQVTQI